jgi:hypothetical protein
MISVQILRDQIRKEIDRDGIQAISVGYSLFMRKELKHHPYGCSCCEYCKSKNRYIDAKVKLSRLRNRSVELLKDSVQDGTIEEMRQVVKEYRDIARQILDRMYPITIR